jgi:PKD repeat protein
VPTGVVVPLQKSVGYADNPAGGTTTYTVTVQLADQTFTVIRTLTVTVLNVAPSFTSFTLSSTDLEAGASVTASGMFGDPGVADTHTVTVDWGDGSTPWTANLAVRVWSFTSDAHPYAGAGTFTVTATVTDKDGGTVTTTSSVSVHAANQAPSVSSLNLTTGAEGSATGLALTFADPDPADTHTVTVAWGDGLTDGPVTLAAGVMSYDATHVYADTGMYALTLTLSDSFGHSVTTGASVAPTNVAPTLGSLTLSPASVVDHQAVTVSGAFTDPGTNDTFTLTIEWGDGQTWTGPLGATERSFSVAHAYANPGTVTIRVTVADRDNGTATTTIDLVVLPSNHEPTNLVLNPSAVAEGGSATLGVTFSDVDVADTHSVFVSWGDGSSETLSLLAGQTSVDARHTYVDSGSFTASVTVTDNGGKSVSGTTTVVVTNVAPSLAAVAVSPSSPADHDTVTVSGSFTDPGINDTFTVTIDWGDQTATTTQSLAAGTRDYSAAHSYATAGTYTVSVTVTDRDGGTGSGTASVVVHARNTGPSDLVLTSSVADLSATVRGTFVDPDAADTHTVDVSWGDGATGTWTLATGARSYSYTHTYAAAGTFTVTVRVTDAAGASVSASTSVTVTAPAPSVSALLDQMSALVVSFNLDRNTERWLLHKIDDLKSSLASGNAQFCSDLKTLDHLDAFAVRTLTDDQLAQLRALSSQVGTAAGCATSSATVKPATTSSKPTKSGGDRRFR